MKRLLTALFLFSGAWGIAQEKSSFLKNFPYLSVSNWTPGMKFVTEPNTINSISTEIELVPYRSKGLTVRRLQQGDFLDKVFTFTAYEKRKEKCANEECEKTYMIFECEGQKYEYASFFTLATMKDFDEASVTGLVYADDIDKCKELLKDKQLYLLDAPWWTDESPRPVKGGKYLPVTITSIATGTQDGPVKISFKPEGEEKEYFINVRLSGINKATGKWGVDFDKAFTFDDPQKSYTDISPETWHNIQHMKVAFGMNKRECDLSWGKPDKVSTQKADEEETEIWYYGVSRQVKFKNGVVEAFKE